MKKVYLTTLAASLVVFLAFGYWYSFGKHTAYSGTIKVGFIYDGDGSTPYSYNFSLGEDALRESYPGRIEIVSRNNVREDETEEPLRELVQSGCEIIFTDGYSEQFRDLSAEFPDVQFCQASFDPHFDGEVPENYHTFKGEAWQGRYVSGIAAGLKLNEMIKNRTIRENEALVGYVASFPTDEVISGFTAFILGVRSVCPSAVMHVRYINSWGSLSLEKNAAVSLIDEGCRVISQHTDTIGPALACENRSADTPVYHVGYNMSMIEVAPSTSIVSTCINWTPYIVGAVGAVLDGKKIEESVAGNVHGNDMSAGFELGWVEMLELNTRIAANDTQAKMDSTVEALKKDRLQVFKGSLILRNLIVT
ncbi:MAG: BMP family ABC transporter substrate-binding protein [Blautia sp.]|nr:BMP family ABC transporter substrate-binding protein [Blautia sp.]